MKLLGSRVDALTITARVSLDSGLLAHLKKRHEEARAHGRVAFDWTAVEPDAPTTRAGTHRLGPHRMRWASEVDRARRVNRLWGELRWSERRGVWNISNEPFFRLQIREHGPRGPELGDTRDCSGCGGSGRVQGAHEYVVKATYETECQRCEGKGRVPVPGWTFEIVFYAQELARSGLDNCLREAEAIAALCGEVEELRLGRLDLCADVEGWTIREDDVGRVAKRARADLSTWERRFLASGRAANDARDIDQIEKHAEAVIKPPRCGPACRPQCICRNVRTHADGGYQRRRMTGISVGSGGAIMCRIYNKRAELERDHSASGETRRAAEEERWRAAKEDDGPPWRGETPMMRVWEDREGDGPPWEGQRPTVRVWCLEASITRVEFQIRSVALKELGIRSPEACMVPTFKTERYRDKAGRDRVRTALSGARVLTVHKGGREVQATLVDRLESIWRTCLEWVRLVVPEETRGGKVKQVSRLKDDPRWELLRTARFDDAPAEPIKRYRVRGAASEAQALGVALSQAGRLGLLRELPEEREAYADDPRVALERLTRRVMALKRAEAVRIVEWLVKRFGDVAGACEHFAVRSNAARVRFYAGHDMAAHKARPPPEPTGEDFAIHKVA